MDKRVPGGSACTDHVSQQSQIGIRAAQPGRPKGTPGHALPRTDEALGSRMGLGEPQASGLPQRAPIPIVFVFPLKLVRSASRVLA